MAGKNRSRKHKDKDVFSLDVPIENAGTVDKKLKVDKKNIFAGEFF